jgi:hypothetical protein
MQVDVYRRASPGVAERPENADAVLRLESVNFSITLGELYE